MTTGSETAPKRGRSIYIAQPFVEGSKIQGGVARVRTAWTRFSKGSEILMLALEDSKGERLGRCAWDDELRGLQKALRARFGDRPARCVRSASCAA